MLSIPHALFILDWCLEWTSINISKISAFEKSKSKNIWKMLTWFWCIFTKAVIHYLNIHWFFQLFNRRIDCDTVHQYISKCPKWLLPNTCIIFQTQQINFNLLPASNEWLFLVKLKWSLFWNLTLFLCQPIDQWCQHIWSCFLPISHLPCTGKMSSFQTWEESVPYLPTCYHLNLLLFYSTILHKQ